MHGPTPHSETSQRDFHDAMRKSSGGFDLVLGPVMLAMLGLWLDRQLGWTPVLMLVLLAFGTVGAVLKVYYDWQRSMAQATEERDRLRAEADAIRARNARRAAS